MLAYLCKRYYWGLIIIFVGCNSDLEQKWAFHTSLIAFGPYSKLKVKSQSSLPKYHMGNNKKCPTETSLSSEIHEAYHIFHDIVVDTSFYTPYDSSLHSTMMISLEGLGLI